MEKENITLAEVWQPSLQLRFLEQEYRYIDGGITCIKTETTLQQLYISNTGNREWRDIPTEIES
jgi:hypothetical protein